MPAISSSAAPDRNLGRIQLSVKGLRFAGHLAVGFAVLAALPLLRKRILGIVGWWYRRLLRILGVEISVRGQPPTQPALLVANHVSWLDIVLLGGLTDAAFISKAEVAQWPFVGRYAKLTGTLFLPRGGFQTGEISTQLQQLMAAGRSALLFPEATTSAALLPERFHARLFGAAIDGGYRVQPIAVHYLPETGDASRHHELAPWVDDTGLLEHLTRLVRLRKLRVRVTYCPPIETRGRDRRTVAKASHEAIVNALSPNKAGSSSTG